MNLQYFVQVLIEGTIQQQFTLGKLIMEAVLFVGNSGDNIHLGDGDFHLGASGLKNGSL